MPCAGSGSWPLDMDEPLADGTQPVGRCKVCGLPVWGFVRVPDHEPRRP